MTTSVVDTQAVQPFERPLRGPAQIGASERNERVASSESNCRYTSKSGIYSASAGANDSTCGDPDAVGVHHEMADRCSLCHVRMAKKSG